MTSGSSSRPAASPAVDSFQPNIRMVPRYIITWKVPCFTQTRSPGCSSIYQREGSLSARALWPTFRNRMSEMEGCRSSPHFSYTSRLMPTQSSPHRYMWLSR